MILSLLSRRLAWSGFVVLSLVLFAGGPAQATLIDSFDSSFNPPQTSIVATFTSPGTAVVNAPGGIIGNQREMVLTVQDGSALITPSTMGGSILQIQGPDGIQSLLQLTYDGNGDINPLSTFDPTGLGGLPLTGTSFLLQVMSEDAITATFRIFTDQNNFSEGVVVTTPTGGVFETFGIAFSDFNIGTGANGAADFSSIGAIQIDLSISGDASVGYNFIQTGDAFSVAPEPGSWALVSLGALGMVGYGWFRRRKPTVASVT